MRGTMVRLMIQILRKLECLLPVLHVILVESQRDNNFPSISGIRTFISLLSFLPFPVSLPDLLAHVQLSPALSFSRHTLSLLCVSFGEHDMVDRTRVLMQASGQTDHDDGAERWAGGERQRGMGADVTSLQSPLFSPSLLSDPNDLSSRLHFTGIKQLLLPLPSASF